MAIKQELNALLTTEMDRKMFLKLAGTSVVAVTGFNTVIKALGQLSADKDTSTKQSVRTGRGYGNSGYGSKTIV